ncbi:CopD family protein [Candidatus Binatus soli]|jgi:putative membrane protein|uniref:CopD family protein n=1 Tax=Candidatus Binatus soli TaxID=1953413 RepID=UPI003D0DCDC4
MHALRGFILAFHIFGVIYWMGGLLMVASLLARVPEEVGLPKERFLGAARGLFETATNLGAAITIVLGLLLILMEPAVLRQGWFHAKLLLVAVLLFYHVRFYRRIMFLEDHPSQSSRREYRVIHGMVSLLLIAILLLVVLKPF